MIFDWKKFQPNLPLLNGALWVIFKIKIFYFINLGNGTNSWISGIVNIFFLI